MTRHPLPLLAIFAALACASASASLPNQLISPWDTKPVAASNIPYSCPAAAPISPDISITGDDDSTDDAVKNAAYSESIKALNDLASHVVRAADIYRATGSLSAAACVSSLLSAAAEGHAMTGHMGSELAWKHQNTTLRAAAISYLKARDSGAIRPEQNSLILNWMAGIYQQERLYYEHSHCWKKKCALLGHSGLEVAVAAMAISIATNDRGVFKWGIDQYRTAVEDIDNRGMLRYDSRGRYALKFHIESAASLVQIAEFAQSNNEPLYDYDHGRVHLLIHTVTRGIVDPSPFRAANGAEQVLPSPLESWEISWASVYNGRFPDALTTTLLQQAGPGGSNMWGGDPLDPVIPGQ